MEYLGENQNSVMGTGHYGKDFPTLHRYNSVHFSALNNQSFNKVYYVYSIVWEENKISWLVNDIVYHTVTPATTAANGQPFVIAVSVGGNLPKVSPLAKDFPDSLIIDYVRVYQKK